MEMKKDTVNVSIRIKPNIENDSTLKIISKDPPTIMVIDRNQLYHFDNIFSEDTNQLQLYNDTIRPFVNHIIEGYNCTIFTYGQTGTGKTYTMGTKFQEEEIHPENEGIIPRVLKQIFEQTSDNINSIDISISFLEIYNEKCYDLLEPKQLHVAGFTVIDLNKIKITNVKDAILLVYSGNKKRHIGDTEKNMNSSRSHAIFTIYFTKKNQTTGKLNLVDLAGSERVKKTGCCQGSKFQEAININQGLLAIGQVISALSINSNHIPYRQSMITSILQPSLNKDSYTCLIACVSSKMEDINETLQTLEFAQRVKRIRSNPEIHQIIEKYKKEYSTTKKTTTPSINRMQSISNSINKSIIMEESVKENFKSIDITPRMLSPILKKHMARMEESIVNRLDTLFTHRCNNMTIEKENNINSTPSLMWSKIRNELPNMVRSELIQLITTTTDRLYNNIHTNSPIDDNGKNKIINRKKLTFPENIKNDGNDFVFQLPEIPKPKKQVPTVATRRRSARLSAQLDSATEDGGAVAQLDSQLQSVSVKAVRRSIRIANKENIVIKGPTKRIHTTRRKETFDNYQRNNIDSPFTRHSKKVLKILNEGSLNELQSLHSIGIKTSEQILLHRNLRGHFQKIDDLSKLPGWGEKKYKKFEELNYLNRI